MFDWHVVHTRPQLESMAAENLVAQGFDVYLPRFRTTRRHARRIDNVIRPLFPRYLFVGFDHQQRGWNCIRSTRGVHELVRQGDAPAIISESVVREIRSREDKSGLVIMDYADGLTPGDRVEIVAGAFCEQIGLFERRNDGNRVVVLLSLLGRSVHITTSVDAIRRCA